MNAVRWSTCCGWPGAEQRLQQRVDEHLAVEVSSSRCRAASPPANSNSDGMRPPIGVPSSADSTDYTVAERRTVAVEAEGDDGPASRQTPSSTARSCGTTGSGSASSGNQRRSADLAGSIRRGSPAPAAAAEEEVDPLVDRVAGGLGAVHRGDRDQRVGPDAHAQLLRGLPDRRGPHRLPRLDVPGRGAGPVPVHEAGVAAQLQQHLVAAPAGRSSST